MLALDDISWTELAAGAIALAALSLVVVLLVRPWRVEATAKAISKGGAISLAGGVGVAGLSASAAAILGGPGVIAVHLRGRKLYERRTPQVTIEALLDWLDALAKRPPAPERDGLLQRMGKRLLARIDGAALPRLGLRVLLGLRDPALSGSIALGFADPLLTGKAAAWLYPLAGVLAPIGLLDVSLDWSGRPRLDGACELSFGVVPARVVLEGLRLLRTAFEPITRDEAMTA